VHSLIGTAGFSVPVSIQYLNRVLSGHTLFNYKTASTSKTHNQEFLRSLGADDVVEYGDLEGKQGEYDTISDTVGGTTLESCWPLVKGHGSLITIDSLSFDFLEKHRKLQLSGGKQDVKALFFIVEHSGQQLQKITTAVDRKLLQVFIAQTFPISKAGEAYEMGSKRVARRGKIVLTM
jgi:NADPH:quinone reductase-like Zn-dependent oxidoreductase